MNLEKFILFMSIISNKLSPKEQSNRLSFQLEINDNNSISQIINADELIQPQQNKKQKLKKYLKDLMFFLRKKMVIINLIIIFLGMLSVISHYIYFKEYSICPYDNYDKCWNQYFIPFAQNEKNWGPYLYTNSLVFTYIFHCLLNKTVPRLYAISSIALYSYLWFFGDSESSIFNMIGTVKLLQMVFTGLFIIAYLTSYGLYLFCKKKIRSKYTLLATCITIIAISIIYQQAKDCSDWGQGINGKIEQTEGNCKMVIPNCFFLKIVAKIDLNFLYHNCFLGQNFKKIYNSYFSRDIANGTIIAFDDFKNSQSQIVVSASNFFNTIYDNAKRFKSIQQAKKDDKRYDVLFDTEHQRYIIKINRNQSLVTEKAQKWKKYQQSSSPPLAKNILMVFFDSLSRNQMHLKMPLLTQWLKKRSKFESYKQKEPKSINKIEQISPQIYYFYRYLSISATTMGNIWPFMYGNPEKIKDIQNFSNNSKIAKLVQNNQTRNGLFKNFVSQFDDRGFITGTSHTHCTPCVAQFFNYHKSHFQQPQFDHQTLSFNCDPNFINKQNFFGWMHGLSAMTDRCLYQKTIAQYNIEYAQSFLDAYKHQPKFYMLNFIEGHSHLGGYIKYIDSDVVDLLDRLEHKGMLDDTAILFLSDHGQHLSDYQSIVADHFNPMLSIYLPKQLNRNYRQKIRKNQQHTLSMFNLYHFVRHLVDGQGYHNKNFSLLNSLIQQRTCEDAFIFSGDCYCIAN